MTKVEQVYRKAKEIGICPLFKPLFTGNESEDELFDLFLSPQGIEYCAEHNFPDIATFRAFRGLATSRKGIYIDTNMRLANPKKIVLVGNTYAELEYDDLESGHEVVLMYGAKAKVKASGNAVVFITNCGGEVETEVCDNARVL